MSRLISVNKSNYYILTGNSTDKELKQTMQNEYNLEVYKKFLDILDLPAHADIAMRRLLANPVCEFLNIRVCFQRFQSVILIFQFFFRKHRMNISMAGATKLSNSFLHFCPAEAFFVLPRFMPRSRNQVVPG